MKTITKTLIVIVMVAILTSAAAPAVYAAPLNANGQQQQAFSVQPNVRSFAKCVIADIKLMPSAKKFTPQGYQDFENTLNTVFNATSGVANMNPYLAALVTGAKLAKFIGYNAIGYIAAVQECWGQLRK
jgi:hypothetical protein